MALDTQTADVLDALYDLFAGTTAITAAVTAGTLRMFDGPPTVDWGAPSMLSVGGAINVDLDNPDVAVGQDWATLGLDAQIDEIIEVPCAAGSSDGDVGAMRTVRRTAIGIYAACATAARATNTPGLGLGGLLLQNVMWCLPYVSAVRQMQGASGAECHVLFTIRVRTRI